MNIRTAGDLVLIGSLAVGGWYARKEIENRGLWGALTQGTSTRAGSPQDVLMTATVVGVGFFLLTRLDSSGENS